MTMRPRSGQHPWAAAEPIATPGWKQCSPGARSRRHHSRKQAWRSRAVAPNKVSDRSLAITPSHAQTENVSAGTGCENVAAGRTADVSHVHIQFCLLYTSDAADERPS